MYFCEFFLKKHLFNLKLCWINPFISGFGPNPIEHWAPTGWPHFLLQLYGLYGWSLGPLLNTSTALHSYTTALYGWSLGPLLNIHCPRLYHHCPPVCPCLLPCPRRFRHFSGWTPAKITQGRKIVTLAGGCKGFKIYVRFKVALWMNPSNAKLAPTADLKLNHLHLGSVKIMVLGMSGNLSNSCSLQPLWVARVEQKLPDSQQKCWKIMVFRGTF